MKKLLTVAIGSLALAAIAWVQTTATQPRAMSELMPGGPLIYLEAKDFHSLLGDWNRSAVKRDWLASANHQVFANSNLFQKLDGIYQEYSGVAGFTPGLPGTLEIAGRESALGLYDLREQQFLYITKIDESVLTASQLWRLRENFNQRQASGVTFYLRRDDASNRTVAFAFTAGYLIVATRDDLIARTLSFLTRNSSVTEGSLASEPWFSSARNEASASGATGEMRLALNMQGLLANDSFRSYWIQRNASELRPFVAGLADVQRSGGRITESRVFIRAEQMEILPDSGALQSLATLRGLVSPKAEFARAWAAPSVDNVQAMIEGKFLAPGAAARVSNRYAPGAVSTDETAGTEEDLETRIDEPPLPGDIAGSLKSVALRDLIDAAAPDAMLQIQSSVETEHFVQTPFVLVISATNAWDAARVREALSSAVETLWTTSRLGVGWRAASAGPHVVGQLDGVAPLEFAIEGRLLFIASDADLLSSVLNQPGTAPATAGPSYFAEFRHAAARPNYERLMQALDFGGQEQSFFYNPQGGRTPPFFSGNLASLGGALGFVQDMLITHVEAPTVERQVIVYQ